MCAPHRSVTQTVNLHDLQMTLSDLLPDFWKKQNFRLWILYNFHKTFSNFLYYPPHNALSHSAPSIYWEWENVFHTRYRRVLSYWLAFDFPSNHGTWSVTSYCIVGRIVDGKWGTHTAKRMKYGSLVLLINQNSINQPFRWCAHVCGDSDAMSI